MFVGWGHWPQAFSNLVFKSVMLDCLSDLSIGLTAASLVLEVVISVRWLVYSTKVKSKSRQSLVFFLLLKYGNHLISFCSSCHMLLPISSVFLSWSKGTGPLCPGSSLQISDKYSETTVNESLTAPNLQDPSANRNVFMKYT